jgi:hypothetical protein
LALAEEFAEKVKGQVSTEPHIFHHAAGIGRTFENLHKHAKGGLATAESRYTAAVSGKPKGQEDLSPEDVATNWCKLGFLGWWKTVMDCKEWTDTGTPAPIDSFLLMHITNVCRHGTEITVTNVLKRTGVSKEYVFDFGSEKEANLWADNLDLLLLKLKVLGSLGFK